jgi:short-subunit dehydrogenase involved in D-alanine esterification of teichoic acids
MTDFNGLVTGGASGIGADREDADRERHQPASPWV